MFKMRIINLVNISTVLLLINLLQTKSQHAGNANGYVLTVSIYRAQLSDKLTGVPVFWNGDYENPETSAFKKLVNDSCATFREYVKSQILSGSDEGLCTSPIFQRPRSGGGVSISLTLLFIYSTAHHFNIDDLMNKLKNNFANFETNLSHKITTANFLLHPKAIVIPTGNPQTIQPPQTEDKDAIDGSKWKLIAIITSVTLIIVLIAGAVAKFGNCC